MELEVANKRLTELSFLDGMTALYNRRSFDVDMAEAWQRQAKDGEAFQLVIASVDMFHQFNSNHGHLAGDDLLKKSLLCLENTCVAKIEFIGSPAVSLLYFV